MYLIVNFYVFLKCKTVGFKIRLITQNNNFQVLNSLKSSFNKENFNLIVIF